MFLAGDREVSWWQCRDKGTHQMVFSEWFDLRNGKKSKQEVAQAMEERRRFLQSLLEKEAL